MLKKIHGIFRLMVEIGFVVAGPDAMLGGY